MSKAYVPRFKQCDDYKDVESVPDFSDSDEEDEELLPGPGYASTPTLKSPEPMTEEQALMKQFKSSLGKLSSDNVDEIATQLIKMCEAVVELDIWIKLWSVIFEKASSEPAFTSTYVTLCSKISRQFPVLNKKDVPLYTFSDAIRDIFLEEVQKTKNSAASSETFEANKKKLQSGIKLTGELGRKSAVQPGSLVEIMTKLTPPHGDETNFDASSCLCIELLITLLTLVGKTLDLNVSLKEKVDSIFEVVDKLANNKALPMRLRCLDKDISELRQNKWLPRILTKNMEAAPRSPSADAHTTDLDDDVAPLLDKLAALLKFKNEASVASCLRVFVKTIGPDHSKTLASCISETYEEKSGSPFMTRAKTLQVSGGAAGPNAIRRSFSFPSATAAAMSRDFYAAVNLIKFNSSDTFNEDVIRSLMNRVSRLKASELTEIVECIFRRMCDLPSEYPLCLRLCTALYENPDDEAFKTVFDTCCQDPNVLQMFSSQASLTTYMRLIKDTHFQPQFSKSILSTCVSKIQDGLFELSDAEGKLLEELNRLVNSERSIQNP